jgi:hypothetical protein
MIGRSRARARRANAGSLADYLVGGSFASQSVGAATSTRGLTLTRSTTGTTHDYAAGTITPGVAIDTGRIAKTAAGRVGLLVEPARTNRLLQSQNPTAAGGYTLGAGASTTRPYGTGPDGSAVTPTRVQAVSGVAGVYRGTTLVLSAICSISWWTRAESSGDAELIGIATIGAGTPGAGASPGTTAWKRRVCANTGALAAASGHNIFATDGRGNTVFSGVSFGATATDQVNDYGQAEVGRWASSVIPTTTGTVLRAADVLTAPSADAVVGESLRFFAAIEVPASRANLAEGASTTLTIFSAGSYYATMSTSTGVITVSARNAGDTAFATDTTTTGIALAANDLLELWVVLGANAATSIKYRINGGAVSTLAMSGATALRVLTSGGSPIGATIDVLNNAGADLLPGTVQAVGFYAAGKAPGGFA